MLRGPQPVRRIGSSVSIVMLVTSTMFIHPFQLGTDKPGTRTGEFNFGDLGYPLGCWFDTLYLITSRTD